MMLLSAATEIREIGGTSQHFDKYEHRGDLRVIKAAAASSALIDYY